jgi:histidyl-tRNA synthetase
MKPALAKGTRDFLPLQAKKRKYIFELIEKVFLTYGYQPLETPAMENLSTLTGKYGEEGDKLLFKILNSGDYLKDTTDEVLQEKDSAKLIPQIAEKGLRYDLTVPFARVVAMNQHLIHFPFKRYQIQNVWRADKPQRGRYREFYQCDADVVGSTSLMYEAELMQIYDQVFSQLGIAVEIQINHRALLEGLAVEAGCGEQFTAMTIALDKLDKIGDEGVKQELLKTGMQEEQATWILQKIKDKRLHEFQFNEKSLLGYTAIQKVMQFNKNYGFQNPLKFEPCLARGLSYYTGCIFEVVPTAIQMGSLGGGGRYDNLTGVFGLKNISGVGISFGADRIYDVMEEENLFPDSLSEPVKGLFMALDEESLFYCFDTAHFVRNAGIPVDVYPEVAKLQKQFGYAEKMKIPYAIIVGDEERKSQSYNLKELSTGEQTKINKTQLLDLLR